ncbi:MAG: SPFH domain-containing protein [Betaproteobacteria bacterium]|nr:SPFH domain-containing protein [Betaproteobacteria bacterium]MCL2886895.1 SPFH domain-containing protein [Betaproteobacteria bacterium]
MFGVRYFKFQPSEYVLRYTSGKLAAEGAGLTFFCYAPRTSIAVLPIGSIDAPFIFEEMTSDFQSVTLQGQLVFRVVNPKETAAMLDYSLNLKGRGGYLSEDPMKLPQRMINSVKVLAKKQLAAMTLFDAMRAGESLAATILAELSQSEEIGRLGLEVMGLSLLAVLANQETTRALEAQTREQILKTADDAVYERRNASIEQERRVSENEYNTEISIEQKKRQVREAQLEAEQIVQQKQNALKEAQMLFEINLEEKRKELVKLAAENARAEADTRAYALKAAMQALQGVDAGVIQSLASVGMKPNKLMAQAFRGLTENADKIGQLNITPDLLREIMGKDAN